jgi:hypothetical protein
MTRFHSLATRGSIGLAVLGMTACVPVVVPETRTQTTQVRYAAPAAPRATAPRSTPAPTPANTGSAALAATDPRGWR